MEKRHASTYKSDIIFQDMLGGGVNIVSIGKEEAYISVIFVNLKENFPVRNPYIPR